MTASAPCVFARRNIHFDAMNIPDSSAKIEFLKVPLEGVNYLLAKVQTITIRDVRETSKAYGIQSRGLKRPLSDKSNVGKPT